MAKGREVQRRMSEILTDNRFDLIEKYKQKLINNTNIESDKKEMAAIDNILFRFWQMGWLDKLEESDAGMTVAEYRERMIQAFHNADCDSLIAVVVLPTEKEFQHLEWSLKKEYVPFLEKANKALNEADELRDQLNNRLDYISELEAKCRDLEEELHKAHLAVEHNRHVADEEQLRGALRYRDGVIYGLKYAMRCNGVSGGEVDR